MTAHPSRRLLFSFSGTCLLTLLLVRHADADALIHYNIQALVHQAETVFSGTCISVHEGNSYSSDLREFGYTEYTFAVEDWVKGEGDGCRLITIRQPRPLPQQSLAGPVSLQPAAGSALLLQAPAYTPGQRYVLFLHAVNQWGLTCPVGSVQGVFEVGNEPDGEPSLVNGLGNVGLFKRTDHLAAAEPDSPTSDEAPSVHSRSRLPASTFLSLIRNLTKQDFNR